MEFKDYCRDGITCRGNNLSETIVEFKALKIQEIFPQMLYLSETIVEFKERIIKANSKEDEDLSETIVEFKGKFN